MHTSLIAHTSSIEHGVIVGLGVMAVVVYGAGWCRIPGMSAWRLIAWCSGVTTLLVSIIPAMEAWAQRSFTGHMVQHLLMIVVGGLGSIPGAIFGAIFVSLLPVLLSLLRDVLPGAISQQAGLEPMESSLLDIHPAPRLDTSLDACILPARCVGT